MLFWIILTRMKWVYLKCIHWYREYILTYSFWFWFWSGQEIKTLNIKAKGFFLFNQKLLWRYVHLCMFHGTYIKWSEHVAHAWSKIGLFRKKNPIGWLFRCDQMSSANRNTWYTSKYEVYQAFHIMCSPCSELPSNISTVVYSKYLH